MLFKRVSLLLIIFSYAEPAKILGMFPFAGVSHYILGSKLMKGLADAGHDVTLVTPYDKKDPPRNGSFTSIILDDLLDQYKENFVDLNLLTTNEENIITSNKMIYSLFLTITNKTMHHPKMTQLVESGAKFDAIIIEYLLSDAFKVYGNIFNCPVILLSSIGTNSYINSMVGNPQIPSYMIHIMNNAIIHNLSIVDRARNLMFYIIEYFLKIYYVMPMQEHFLHALYPNSPPLQDLYTNVSLVLLNSHTSTHPALPLVPNMIEIGGYFIDPPKKLPIDLQEYMDGASDGIIYFSMGSQLKSKDLPEHKKQALLNVFGKLKQKVIWKFEEDLPGKPSNVMIKKWCPQSDILAHPNTRLFITHGGLLSITEAVYHGIPILAIPVFAEQPMNAAKAEASGIGLKIAYNDPDFGEEKIEYLINELLTNPKYKETAQEKSKFYHDRPMKPMETATYWVDYVIRHKGAPHLRVAGITLPWYKYFMVDVLGIILFGLISFAYIIKFILKKLIHKIISQKEKIA